MSKVPPGGGGGGALEEGGGGGGAPEGGGGGGAPEGGGGGGGSDGGGDGGGGGGGAPTAAPIDPPSIDGTLPALLEPESRVPMNSTEAKEAHATYAVQAAVFLRLTVPLVFGVGPLCWSAVCYAASCSLNFFYHRSKTDGRRRIDRINLGTHRSGGDRTGLEDVEDMHEQGLLGPKYVVAPLTHV